MLNQNENLFKMFFEILDFDEDGLVTELDLYAAFKIYEYQDDLFIKAFSEDLALVEKKIIEKKIARGVKNNEVAQKLSQVEKRVAKFGGTQGLFKLLDKNKNETNNASEFDVIISDDSESLS
jgi:hypothetical protein